MENKKELRKARSYKVTDKRYLAAMKRAKKEKGALTNIIEAVVIGYGAGLDVRLYKEGTGKASILDLFSTKNGKLENFVTINSKTK